MSDSAGRRCHSQKRKAAVRTHSVLTLSGFATQVVRTNSVLTLSVLTLSGFSTQAVRTHSVLTLSGLAA